MGPGPKIWAQGPKSGGPRARAPSFPIGYFLETRVRILTTPTFKEKLSLQASRPFPGGAPRKVSMFKIYLAGRSSDMSVSCPETIFFSPKWQDSGCGFFKVLTFQEHKLLTCQEPGMLGVGNPFSEKMFQKHRFFHGSGAARHSEHNEPDEGKMVHDRQFGP